MRGCCSVHILLSRLPLPLGLLHFPGCHVGAHAVQLGACWIQYMESQEAWTVLLYRPENRITRCFSSSLTLACFQAALLRLLLLLLLLSVRLLLPPLVLTRTAVECWHTMFLKELTPEPDVDSWCVGPGADRLRLFVPLSSSSCRVVPPAANIRDARPREASKKLHDSCPQQSGQFIESGKSQWEGRLTMSLLMCALGVLKRRADFTA